MWTNKYLPLFITLVLIGVFIIIVNLKETNYVKSVQPTVEVIQETRQETLDKLKSIIQEQEMTLNTYQETINVYKHIVNMQSNKNVMLNKKLSGI